ncbi:hypothetical protein PF005_g20305 [Phytophthora fragariae]|uniref:Uncharacterized protein n=1 Tax=Phytophthora fragariae TaxID=53985 RepID=A0A6A3R248_9STRA|nr:hypothetical protein PF009_g21257 [Phytophthora fragariae]KAE8988616.1 hypothetical protein PF011_g19105 [Phytophthora fragariae]KAE9088296.1 hypothetical protein PF007_g20032 [Phytophthora fragariae]KAE9116342.1 hypothetical protein PF006_g19072 [Phytophthora fragariae]KAE9187831.1 hypothetical protein PF005_g20305 [Phytophthora fragariae]
MTKSRDEANAAVIKRLRARLERKSRGATAEADAQLRAQVDFFARLRTVLFVNVDSLGTTALDDTALAVLANDASLPSGIRCPAVLLPDPSGMDIEPAPKHDLFALPEVPTAAGKRSASQSADDKRTPVTKKQRTFARPHQYSLDLPATCPPDIQRDVEKLVQTAASQGKTPPRYAYQWVGQRAWYDPNEFPDLYLMHWRYYMRHRDTFFDCALYAPPTTRTLAAVTSSTRT